MHNHQFNDGREYRMVEFLNSYCVYGWDVNYMCKIPPGVPTAAIGPWCTERK